MRGVGHRKRTAGRLASVSPPLPHICAVPLVEPAIDTTAGNPCDRVPLPLTLHDPYANPNTMIASARRSHPITPRRKCYHSLKPTPIGANAISVLALLFHFQYARTCFGGPDCGEQVPG